MAPLNLILSSSVLTNCFWDLRGYTSVTRVLFPTKLWAIVTPESMAGVFEKMVSGSNRFRSPMDVESWESGHEMLPHRIPSGGNSPLSGFVEGFLNGVFFDPAKIGPEFLKINWLSLDSMFVLRNVGVARMREGVVNSPHKIAKFINPRLMCTASGEVWGPGGVTSCGRVGVI